MRLVKKLKSELKQKALRPIKHFGQNFLVSKEIIEKIIRVAKIKTSETILEVGPGTGNLTKALLENGANVLAVEKDGKLAKLLKSKSPHFAEATQDKEKSNLKIIEGDILRFDETAIKNSYRVVANIPYYLTGALIQKFLLSPNKPSEMILMVQKEVGERIAAQPPKANFLSSLVQFLAKTEVLFRVNKENFWPQPKVDSALIKLIPHQRIPNLRSYVRYTLDVKNEEFIEFLKVIFKQPRQTLFNNLKKTGTAKSDELEKVFKQLEFDKKIRAQNLNQEQLIKLFSLLGY